MFQLVKKWCEMNKCIIGFDPGRNYVKYIFKNIEVEMPVSPAYNLLK
jgi:hypothetical protein